MSPLYLFVKNAVVLLQTRERYKDNIRKAYPNADSRAVGRAASRALLHTVAPVAESKEDAFAFLKFLAKLLIVLYVGWTILGQIFVLWLGRPS